MTALLASIEFARPLFLWGLPLSLAPIYIVLWLRPQAIAASTAPLQGLAQQAYRHPASDWLRDYLGQQQQQARLGVFIRRAFSWTIIVGLLHLALAQPYRLGQRLPDPPQQRDIVFVIDTSVSMVLEDYLVDGQRISRMRMLQSVMQHFINQLQRDPAPGNQERNRISLVVYSEQVYTLASLTTDYALLQRQFNRMVPAVLTGRTSNPGKALLYTLEQFKDDTGTERPTIVLISDVNRPDRDIDPRVASASLKQHGFHVHSIAIGAGSYAAENRRGTHLVYHPTHYQLLQQIAAQGAGKFFSVNDAQSIQRALHTIQQGEKRQVAVEPQYIKRMLYHWPLLVAVLLVTLAQLWQLLRRTR